MMWTVDSRISATGDRCLYRIERESVCLDYLEVVELWRDDANFREFFSRMLLEAPYAVFRWETPALSCTNTRQPFECVLLDSPWLAGKSDSVDFSEHFAGIEAGDVVTFANLGGDAILVAPSPVSVSDDYAHIGAWLRNSPSTQQHALWVAVAKAVLGRLGSQPLWLSTAGGGVPWLHVRLDDRPKYYSHADYRVSG